MDDQQGLDRLISIVKRLLAPDGCPWDRSQTHSSMRKYLIEEAYEVIDAIDENNNEDLCEELGDLLLQIVFHAELGRNAGTFTIDEVIQSICEKLIRRHPHVFGDEGAQTAEEVETLWDRQKEKEGKSGKKGKKERKNLCDGISKHLPSLRRAHRIGERLSRVGFDWPDADGPRLKIDEELRELDDAIRRGDKKEIEAELGDVLLSVSNLGRHLDIDSEDALRIAINRFQNRFELVEKQLDEEGRKPEQCTLDELEKAWQEAKKVAVPPGADKSLSQ